MLLSFQVGQNPLQHGAICVLQGVKANTNTLLAEVDLSVSHSYHNTLFHDICRCCIYNLSMGFVVYLRYTSLCAEFRFTTIFLTLVYSNSFHFGKTFLFLLKINKAHHLDQDPCNCLKKIICFPQSMSFNYYLKMFSIISGINVLHRGTK